LSTKGFVSKIVPYLFFILSFLLFNNDYFFIDENKSYLYKTYSQ